MARQTVNMFWIFLVISTISSSFFFPSVHVEAAYNYSTNPADYDFGWFANGTYPNGSEPYCTFCVNGLTYDVSHLNRTADEEIGPYWNLTVGTYRCDGVELNEMWAFHEPTQTIVFGNLTQVLCIDAVEWNAWQDLKLRHCNSSVITQQWRKNGSRLISALKSGGEELFMVGEYPNKATSPTNQQYEYRVTLNTAVPPPSSGFTYSSDFTFLSANKFIDRSTNLFTTEGRLAITNFTKDEVVNGGFESSSIQAGTDQTWSDWTQQWPSYFALCGWVIDYGPIDYVKAGLLAPAEGSYSVHLNTFTNTAHWGQVSQTFITEVGSDYQLSFYFNGFPNGVFLQNGQRNCSVPYTTAEMQVRMTNSTATGKFSSGLRSDGYGNLQQNFSIDISGSNTVNFNGLWQAQFVTFRTSTNITTVSFESLNFNNSCGPMIDKVAVLLIKPKSFWESTTFHIILGVVAGLSFLVVILLSVYYGRRRWCVPEEDYSGLYKTENARIFSLKELSSSTRNFSAVLGEGAFGTVYKAEFPDGTAGAVKVEKPKERIHFGFHSSKTLASEEIAVLLRVHHRNLVNLTGFCIHRGRHMLVFEYLPNGSLYDRLHESVIPFPPGDIMDSVEMRKIYSKTLSWQQRVKIACDVAYGLEYLHHDADPPIVHRDVKSRNILLTATDSAKLADFGLSKAAPAEALTFESIETVVRGSIGYLDPQYFLTGVFSAKSDVYSYGVVLLELISGLQAIHNAASLASWAAPYLTSPSLYPEMVDKKLNGKYELDELESLVELSKMCMQEDSKMRPNMRQVVSFLNARQLVLARGESSEQVTEETISREAYHKMHPLFIDFEALATKESSGSSDNIFTSPRPRD